MRDKVVIAYWRCIAFLLIAWRNVIVWINEYMGPGGVYLDYDVWYLPLEHKVTEKHSFVHQWL